MAVKYILIKDSMEQHQIFHTGLFWLRACLKNHSCNLHTLIFGVFYPMKDISYSLCESVSVRDFLSFYNKYNNQVFVMKINGVER